LFIFRFGKWDLPKGKIDGKESPEEAAIREVKEETGLSDIRILGPLPSTYHIFQGKVNLILKRTWWFEMEAGSNQRLIPQTEEDISEVKWVARGLQKDVLENTYGSIKELVMIDKRAGDDREWRMKK
jgi:8-oxo-dGTP pyrophosphatase MutT (NUDIX family)